MRLIDLSLLSFLEELSGDTATPGGGSVAAIAGAMAAGLTLMVARLTSGKKKYEDAWEAMEGVISAGESLSKELLDLVDRDTSAYNRVMEAFRLPREEETRQRTRKEAIQAATRQAAEVPLETLSAVDRLAGILLVVVERGNPHCITDAGVALQLIRTAAKGAAYNVRINLQGIEDQAYRSQLEADTEERLDRVLETVAGLEAVVERAVG